METENKKTEEVISTAVELDSRRSEKLTITLWWVRGTIDTYVTIADLELGSLDVVGVPAGVGPNQVYNHPFAYQRDN